MKRRLRLLFLHMLAIITRRFVRRHVADPPRRILYFKPDHLGDLLLATPVLAALRQLFPHAHVTALVGRWAEVTLVRNPDVDTVQACPFPGFERQQPPSGWWSPFRPYWLLLGWALRLRAVPYDLAIIGRDDHWWGAALALLAGIPRRIGVAVPECRPFLTHALPWNPRDHVTRQGLAMVAAAGGVAAEELHGQARFDPPASDLAWADAWFATMRPDGRPLVVIHPGTAGPTKLWASRHWARVADALADAGALVVLTGGPGEEHLVAQVASLAQSAPVNLAGHTSFGQLAAVLRRATLVLGVDSGPLHLAAAQGRPSVHLYGPGDAGRFGPWGDPNRHRVIRADLFCSPCGVFSACPRGLAEPECMQRIAVEPVVQAALEGVQRNRRVDDDHA